MLNFWKAADDMENIMAFDTLNNKPIYLKIDPFTLNNMLGGRYYDTFPRIFKESNGNTLVSSESNVVLSAEYITNGSCSFKQSNYRKYTPQNMECASSCEYTLVLPVKIKS
jgi:hypothetical protein